MSQWYAAHILMYVKRKNHTGDKVPVWENVVLIKADSERKAFAKARAQGKRQEGDDDGTFRWNGERARWVFAGVRKLTLCEDPEKRPTDGSELTYTELELSSMEALQRLLDGKPVSIKVTDECRTSHTQNGRGTTVASKLV